MHKLYLTLFLAIVFTKNTSAQSLAINTDGSTANASALLDVKSTNKGLLIPRMSKTERNGIVTPATGLLVFQNAPDSVGFYYYDGSKWNWMAAINGNADTLAWKRNGNTTTDTAVNFIGTTDNMPMRFKLNNQWAGQWDADKGNYFIGKNTGRNTYPTNSVNGRNNFAVGDNALFSNTTGISNIAIGYQSLFSNTIGVGNIANGYRALYLNTSGDDNIANGYQALYSNLGNNNIANGYWSLVANSSGNNNIANGRQSLRSNTSGENNIANGYQALYNNETADNNIANGNQSLFNNTIGVNNIANGYKALYLNTAGDNNIANGYQALYRNLGNNNIANGYLAMNYNSGGNNNIANGFQALYANHSGSQNIAMGYIALSSNTIGSSNIALGLRAMELNITGYGNIAIGSFALESPDEGIYNTAVGYSSDVSLSNATNASALGYNATAPASNYVRIGNTAVTAIVGQVAFTPSDGRFKTNVQNTVPGLDFIMGLRPVTYHFEKATYSRFIGEKQDDNYVLKLQKQDAENKTSTGFIAQEVEALAKRLNYDFDGLYKPQNDKDAYGLGYQQFVTPLIKAVQEQQQLIMQQDQLIKQQQVLYSDVLKRLTALENK